MTMCPHPTPPPACNPATPQPPCNARAHLQQRRNFRSRNCGASAVSRARARRHATHRHIGNRNGRLPIGTSRAHGAPLTARPPRPAPSRKGADAPDARSHAHLCAAGQETVRVIGRTPGPTWPAPAACDTCPPSRDGDGGAARARPRRRRRRRTVCAVGFCGEVCFRPRRAESGGERLPRERARGGSGCVAWLGDGWGRVRQRGEWWGPGRTPSATAATTAAPSVTMDVQTRSEVWDEP